MPGTEDFWIIEVVAGQADRDFPDRDARRQARSVAIGLLTLAAVGVMVALGYLAYRLVSRTLLGLAAVGEALLLGVALLHEQMVAILALIGRWALIVTVGGVRPRDILDALEVGRWLRDAWPGS